MINISKHSINCFLIEHLGFPGQKRAGLKIIEDRFKAASQIKKVIYLSSSAPDQSTDRGFVAVFLRGKKELHFGYGKLIGI